MQPVFRVNVGQGGSMASGVYEQLKDAIVTCLVMPGENLHEADLAAQFNVSKTPIREALHLLRRDGFITSFARHGHQVAHMTVEDVREIFQLRLMVEPAMAALAAGALDEASVAELRGLAQVRYAHGDEKSYETFLLMTRRFHEIIAGASGNQRLMKLAQRLVEETERFLRLSLDADDASAQLARERDELVDAIAAGDGVRAERVCRAQIELSRQRIVDAIANKPFKRAGDHSGPGIHIAWAKAGGEWQTRTVRFPSSNEDDADSSDEDK
ncbi:MAG: hypothetical protein QOK43_2574 [Acidimicrobiaceae bacterium]|nr:hypothetical protein [Acidimicrobiaceae bacterium]